MTAYKFRSHYNHLGKVCHCPWGSHDSLEHFGAVKESSKYEWLQNRPDMQTHEGQRFLKFVKDKGYTKADRLLPWMAREFQKGRLDLKHNFFTYRDPNHSQGGLGVLEPQDALKTQNALEEMKKRRRGIDVMQHQVHELMPKVKEFHDWKKSQERQDLGEVLHKFDNGWSVRRLQNAEEHEDEGELMGHCVGGSEYTGHTDAGSRIYASLRDEKNLPHATMELEPDHWYDPDLGVSDRVHSQIAVPRVGPSSTVRQFFGKEDSAPKPEYHDMMNQWLSANDGPEAEMPNQTIEIPAPWDIEEYNYQRGDGFDPYEYAPDNFAADLDEGPDVQFEEPDWNRIVKSYLNPDLDSHERGEFFDNVRERYDTSAFEHHLHQRATHPSYSELSQQWEQWKQPYYHPYTGEYVEGGYTQPPIDQFQNRLFNEVDDRARKPAPIVPQYQFNRENLAEGTTDLGPQQGPLAPPYIPWTRNPNLSSTTAPLYYRWVYSPTKGVTLGSNQDDHPALVPYHQGLGGQADGQSLLHGYAYRIGNGWRLTMYDHKAVEDPFVVNQVVRTLNNEEEPQKRAEGSWQPVRLDWDRLHFSLPQEKKIAI